MKKKCSIFICIVLILCLSFPAFAEIKRNSRGEDVVVLQERLIELGFLDDVADGIFGKNTESALKAFQEANGLEVSGVATIKDINVIFSDDAIGVINNNSVIADTLMIKEPSSKDKTDTGNSIQNVLSESYIIERLALAPNVAVIAPVTEENDPNGNLGKPGGYTSQIYFSSPMVSGSYAKGKSASQVISEGTSGGGSIEVYATAKDALKRDAYLGAFDGTGISVGSHKVEGTMIIRTSSELSMSEQEALTQEILTVLSENYSDASQPMIEEENIKDLPMISVVESGFDVSDGYFFYAVKLHNNSEDKAVEFPEIKITLRDQSGGLLAVANQVLSVIYPNQDVVWAGQGGSIDEMPSSVEVEVLDPANYNIVSPIKMQHTEYIPLEVKNAKIKNNGFYDSLLGEVYNPNDYDIGSLAIIVVFRNADGQMLAGDCGFANSLHAQKSTAFEIIINSDIATDIYEVYAMPW